MEVTEGQVLDLILVVAKESSSYFSVDKIDKMFGTLPDGFRDIAKKVLIKRYRDGNALKINFIGSGDTFNINRAACIFLVESLRVSSSLYLYDGMRYNYNKRISERTERYKKLDYILNHIRKEGRLVEFLDQVVSKAGIHTLNTNCRMAVVRWIAEEKVEITEDLIKIILKGYFKGKEKTEVMKALIENNELAKLEIFWKSRAVAVQKQLIEIAPLEKLPFLLGTKNKKILELIEKRMMQGV